MGFTMVELVVAMVVFTVAMAGVFPLVATLSRQIQPIRKADPNNPGSYVYEITTPGRDWESDSRRSTWYLAPFSDPWARKLGGGARITTDNTYSAASIEPSTILRNDDDDSTDSDGDGLQDYVGDLDTGWTYDPAATAAYGGNHHRKIAWKAGSESTGAATWSIKIAVAGWYSVQTTWDASLDQITDAHYSVTKNSGTIAEQTVSQQASPVGISDADGRIWLALTSAPVSLAQGDTIQVILSDVRGSSAVTNMYVASDAVRLVHNEVSLNSLTRTPNDESETVTASVSVAVAVPK
jgi:hypothetical protein